TGAARGGRTGQGRTGKITAERLRQSQGCSCSPPSPGSRRRTNGLSQRPYHVTSDLRKPLARPRPPKASFRARHYSVCSTPTDRVRGRQVRKAHNKPPRRGQEGDTVQATADVSAGGKEDADPPARPVQLGPAKGKCGRDRSFTCPARNQSGTHAAG